MKKTLFKPASFASVVLVAALIGGCRNDNSEQLSPAQAEANATAAAQDNSQMISATTEMMDATSGAFAEKGITGGRTISEGRESTWGCKPSVSGTFNINNSIPDSLIYSGSITLDYGTGASCPDGANRRSGKITDTFVYAVSLKNKSLFTSSESISFGAFHKDSVQFDGIVVIKSATKSPTTVEAQSTKITYADGTSSTWNGTLAFDYQKADRCRDWGGNTLTVTGSLSGTTRKNVGFSAAITRGIVFKNNCSIKHQFIPVMGTVLITTNGATSTLDYGDGKCDKSYTITTNGTTTVYAWDNASL